MLTGPSFIPKSTKYALVLLHGYGADGNDLFSLASHLNPVFPEMAIFAPNAPSQTMLSGYEWFSLEDYFSKTNLDISYLNELSIRGLKTMPLVEEYITSIETKLNIPRENIFIAGFSQGGLMASLTAFHSKQKFKGLILMSPVPMASIPTTANKIPVLLTRGLQDDVIPSKISEMTRPILEKNNFLVQESIDPYTAHGISLIHLSALIQFIKENI